MEIVSANRGFLDQDLLETTLKGLILLDVLAVLAESGGTNAVQLATGQHGLEKIGSVHAALAARTGAHEQMDFVDEKNDRVLGILNLLQDTLHALFELSTVLAASNKGADIER